MLVAGVLASARVLVQRMAFEADNRTVEIVVDYRDLLDSIPLHAEPSDALGRVGALGITTIGVYEDDVRSLVDAGVVKLLPRSRAGGATRVAGGAPASIVLSTYPRVIGVLRAYMTAYFGGEACPQGMRYCFLPATGDRLEKVTLGLPAVDTSLAIAPRLGNSPFETPESLRLKLQRLEELPNLSAVIFDGDSVLGHPALIPDVSELMLEKGINYGWLEMVEQDGAGSLRSLAGKNMIPVHSVSVGELEKTSADERIERYVRAVRERGVRVLYVHLPAEYAGRSREGLAVANLVYLSRIVEAVEGAGYVVGRAAPIGEFEVSPVARTLVFGGLAAFCLLLLSLVFEIPGILLLLLGVLGYPAYAVAARVGLETTAVKMCALGAACLVPACAVAVAFLRGRPADGEPQALDFGKTVAAWMQATLLTTVGGFFIASLLSGREFFLRIDVFSGVKLAYVLPLFFVVWFFYRWSRISAGDFFDRPIRYAEAAILFVLVAIVGIYLLRSGHDGPTLISGIEKEMRDFLEAVFVVRPRTKEFLVGHPALIVIGLVPFARGALLPAAILLVGAIAMVSITNTFCHLHTPFVVSLSRTMTGILLGAAVGFSARWVIQGVQAFLPRGE